MKKFVLCLLMTLMLFTPTIVNATVCCDGNDQSQSQSQSQSQIQGQSQSQVSTSNSSATATGGSSSATATGGTAYGGQGGSAVAYGGAGGEGGQGGSAYNKLKIKVEDKRDLPNIPQGQVANQLEYRGPYGAIFEKVRPWEKMKVFTDEQIKGFPECGFWDDCNVGEAVLVPKSTEPSKRIAIVPYSDRPFMAMVIVTAANPLQLFGTVARLALQYAADEIAEVAYRSSFSNKSTGYNFGLGGGVSVINGGQNDNIGGSVGGGTGFGSVTTKPVENIRAAFVFYRNK